MPVKPAQKILYCCNYFQPMNYGENEISRSLAEQGYQVHILTGDKYFPFPNYQDTVGKLLGPRQQKSGSIRRHGITIIRNKIWAEFAARALFFGVKEKIAEFKPDIILISGVSTPVAIQAALFKPKTARLILVDSHLPSELTQGNQVLKQLFYGLFRIFFAPLISQRADKIIAVQEATSQVIRETYGIPKPATIISHGTNVENFTFSAANRKKLRSQLQIPTTAFVIIYTGKIIPVKGVDLLFKATVLLLKKQPQLHLLVVGDGPAAYKEQCLKLVPATLKKNVHLVGFRSQADLPAYYSAADLAAWPLQESLAMNDAISCGLPLLVNDQIGVKERFSNNNALFYAQGKVADLAAKIKYLYQNPAARKKMGQLGRKLAEKTMSWNQKAQAYVR